MMRKIFLCCNYLVFLIRSKTWHAVHSPFVFDVVKDVFRKPVSKDKISATELFRARLLSNRQVIETVDFGCTGSYKSYCMKLGPVKKFASGSCISKKDGELLFKLVQYFKPFVIVELGTCFGLSTSYLATGNPQAKVYTIEGCAVKAQIAQANFSEKGLNVKLYIGKFYKLIEELLSDSGTPGFVFIDGDHSYAATLSAFERFAKVAHPDTILVFHDIYHSSQMKRAWKKMCRDQRISVSLDLFSMGILFFRQGIVKQHFRLRY